MKASLEFPIHFLKIYSSGNKAFSVLYGIGLLPFPEGKPRRGDREAGLSELVTKLDFVFFPKKIVPCGILLPSTSQPLPLANGIFA
jgi:hypothetical protein